MKKIRIILFLIFSFIMLPIDTFSLSLSCRSCILMDTNSGRILYEKNMDQQRLIASTTKIMTAILAIESGKLDDIVEVGDEVLKMYGSNIYIEVGEKISLRDLLYGLMLRSGNDAAVVIATYISGNEEKFVELMNKKAKELGMKNTIFNNCHGLDENTQNMSTAYDMALLSRYVSNNSVYMEIVGTKKYTVKTDKKTYLWTNRNKLLFDYKYTTGGKTGYTPNAGKTLVTTAKKDGLNLTAVTLNDGNQYLSHKEMYEYGFNNYKLYKILNKNRIKIDDAYYKDKLYLKNDFYYPLTDLETDNIKVKLIIEKLYNYENEQCVGNIYVFLNNDEIYRDKVYVSKKKNKSKNIFIRIKENLFG